MIAWTIVGLITGTVVAGVIGAGQDRPKLGILLALPTGILAGAAGGALLAVPGKFLTIAGAALLLLLGLVVRFLSKGGNAVGSDFRRS